MCLFGADMVYRQQQATHARPGGRAGSPGGLGVTQENP